MNYLKLCLVCVFSMSAVFASGCEQSAKTYIINPDGSGKIKFSVVQPDIREIAAMSGYGVDGLVELSAEERINIAWELFFESSYGVEAWKDLKAIINDNGDVVVTGIAYFKDISKACVSCMESAMILENTDDGMKIYLEACEPPELIELQHLNQPSVPADASDDELKKRVARHKAGYEESKKAMTSMVGKMSIIQEFYLPGKITVCDGLKKTADGKGVVLVAKGKQFLEGLDKINADDAMLLRMYRNEAKQRKKEDIAKDPDFLKTLNLLFGIEKFPVAVFSGGEPLFDYPAELAVAKAEWEKVKDKYADYQ